jgi:transcriptional regulator with XRE-family HTH domain
MHSHANSEIAKEQRNYVERVVTRSGWSMTELARKARIDHSTLSRFMGGGREGHALRHSTIRKIELATGLPFAANSTTLVGPAGRTDGFGESEATPILMGETVDTLVLAALRNHNNADAWCLRSRALENLGYRPGDTLIVELGITPRAGDVVCAQVYDWSKGGAETVFRSFQPPYLVAQSNDERLLRPLLVDDHAVIIKGVVTTQFRSRPLSPKAA